MEKNVRLIRLGKNRFSLLFLESPDFPLSGVNGFQDLGEKKPYLYKHLPGTQQPPPCLSSV